MGPLEYQLNQRTWRKSERVLAERTGLLAFATFLMEVSDGTLSLPGGSALLVDASPTG